MGTRRKPWWQGQQWEVIARTPQGWQAIYHSSTRSKAKQDAEAWTRTRGQQTEVVRGPGHASNREQTDAAIERVQARLARGA